MHHPAGLGDGVRPRHQVPPQLPGEVPHDLHHRLQVDHRAEVRDYLQEELPHHLQADGE